MKKFLIMNIFGIGDVLFSTPVISNLKLNFPDCEISYVCNRRAELLLKNHPQLKNIYVYERDEFQTVLRKSKRQFLKKMFSLLSDIKSEKFDVVVDLTLNPYASFFMWWVGIKTRVGLNYKNRSVFLSKKIEVSGFEGKHVVEFYLDTLRAIGCSIKDKKIFASVAQVDLSWAQNIIKEIRKKDEELLVSVVPGGGASWGREAHYRRWPPERHSQVLQKISEQYAVKFVLLGDESEKKLEDVFLKEIPERITSLIGKTNLGQYLAILSLSDLVLVNDGGPLHMAVSVGAKTVSLIGTVDEAVYGPYPLQGHRVVTSKIPCRPCYRQFRHAECHHISCLHSITVDEVVGAVEKQIKLCRPKQVKQNP